jgi:hypothetical protein
MTSLDALVALEGTSRSDDTSRIPYLRMLDRDMTLSPSALELTSAVTRSKRTLGHELDVDRRRLHGGPPLHLGLGLSIAQLLIDLEESPHSRADVLGELRERELRGES